MSEITSEITSQREFSLAGRRVRILAPVFQPQAVWPVWNAGEEASVAFTEPGVVGLVIPNRSGCTMRVPVTAVELIPEDTIEVGLRFAAFRQRALEIGWGIFEFD